jgi:hypothetical protein
MSFAGYFWHPKGVMDAEEIHAMIVEGFMKECEYIIYDTQIRGFDFIFRFFFIDFPKIFIS